MEHPVAARSWKLQCVRLLEEREGAAKVSFDFCELGMVGEDKIGRAPIRKRASILTSSNEVAAARGRSQCSGTHRHVKLTASGTKTSAQECQVYPEEFCRVLCKAYATPVDKDAMAWKQRRRRQPIGRSRVPAMLTPSSRQSSSRPSRGASARAQWPERSVRQLRSAMICANV